MNCHTSVRHFEPPYHKVTKVVGLKSQGWCEGGEGGCEIRVKLCSDYNEKKRQN